MNVSLTPELEKFVQNEVSGGLYQTASEVVRAGLRRLMEDQTRRVRTPQNLEELEARLLESLDRVEGGAGVDGEEAFRRVRQRINKARASG